MEAQSSTGLPTVKTAIPGERSLAGVPGIAL